MVKKSKGFTLIELLAVIVILAIILLIATPIILNIIDDVRKGALKSSAHGYTKAAEYKYLENKLSEVSEEKIFTYVDGKLQEDDDLDFGGETPKNGTIHLRKDGKVALSIHNGKYCAMKEYNSNKITVEEKVIDDCQIPVPPGQPLGFLNLPLDIVRGSSFKVDWDEASSWGFPLTDSNYRIEYKYNDDDWILLADTGTNSEFSHDLSPDISYSSLTYRIRSENSVGYSNWIESSPIILTRAAASFVINPSGSLVMTFPTEFVVGDTYRFNYTNNSNLNWTLPFSGTIKMEAYGAKGSGGKGGAGGQVQGNITLPQNSILNFKIHSSGNGGGAGGVGGGNAGQAGSGGSVISTSDNIIITGVVMAAAGGGGQGGNGTTAAATTDGCSGTGGAGGAGGIGGAYGIGGNGVNGTTICYCGIRTESNSVAAGGIGTSNGGNPGKSVAGSSGVAGQNRPTIYDGAGGGSGGTGWKNGNSWSHGGSGGAGGAGGTNYINTSVITNSSSLNGTSNSAGYVIITLLSKN